MHIVQFRKNRYCYVVMLTNVSQLPPQKNESALYLEQLQKTNSHMP